MYRARNQQTPQDWDRLALHLAQAGHHLHADPPARQFSGGLANLNYQVMLDGAPAVLRCPPAGPTAAGANDMAREARVLTSLPAHYPLAPRLLHFCADPGVLGVPFQLIEYRPGVAIGATPPSAVSGAQTVHQLTTAMAQLHALNPVDAGLATLGRSEGFLARQVSSWTARADAAFDGEVPSVCTEALRHLAATVPASGPSRLIHSDFKPNNMLFDPATGTATAVIDWDMCTLGDPLFDLGVLLAYWVAPTDPLAVHALNQVPSLCTGWPDRAGVAHSYFAASNRPPESLAFHLLLGRVRLAVAWVQLWRLYQLGSLRDPGYAQFMALALDILAHGLDQRADTVI